MSKSLYTKLVLIIIALILSLMAVVGAFLMRGILSFYQNDFYLQMQQVFGTVDIGTALKSAANDKEAPTARVEEVMRAYFGELGINSGTRSFYILDSYSAKPLKSSDQDGKAPAITKNILSAMKGNAGYENSVLNDYMDVAIPIPGSSGSFIIYILDNKETVRDLSEKLSGIILESLLIGLVISVLLSLLLAKTMVTPIQSLTRAAERFAGGDFSDKLETRARDEIGVLTRTFNDMACRLETTLDDLTHSEQLRREFVANVSHELRTPITSIRSYAETLSDSEGMSPETQKEFLDVIVNESDRMTKIVQDLLTLSRFDAGSIEFNFEYFPIEKALSSVYNAMLLEAQRYRHDFSLHIIDELPQIRGDCARIERVLINLVSNAIKYTPRGGKIEMSAEFNWNTVSISVRDNGLGIPDADAPRVFDRFYRVDKARSRESGGTGLGLAIAKEIVNRHDGDIELESQYGVGTVVVVSLPVEGPQHD